MQRWGHEGGGRPALRSHGPYTLSKASCGEGRREHMLLGSRRPRGWLGQPQEQAQLASCQRLRGGLVLRCADIEAGPSSSECARRRPVLGPRWVGSAGQLCLTAEPRLCWSRSLCPALPSRGLGTRCKEHLGVCVGQLPEAQRPSHSSRATSSHPVGWELWGLRDQRPSGTLEAT